MPKKNEKYIFVGGIVVACGLLMGSGLNGDNFQLLVTKIDCYLIYFLVIKVFKKMCSLGLEPKRIHIEINNKIQHLLDKCEKFALLLIATVGFLFYSNATISTQDFLIVFVAYFITKYLEMDTKSPSINYGVGMACSFLEGYLVHIIPNDGGNFVGFEDNIRTYESREKVVFPVKKLFIIITKSLYCPPDLKQFNKKDKYLPHLEACKSLKDLEKDVAGVKNRIYRNSAYKIHRNGSWPVYVAIESATPLHTLHRALEKTVVHEVLGKVDASEIVREFCSTLETLLDKTPDCRGKCELVYFDDTDPNQNLAEVLLDKIRELEPNLEQIIRNT